MKMRLLLIIFGTLICLTGLMVTLRTHAQIASGVDTNNSDELVLLSQMGGGEYQDILVVEGYIYVATASNVTIFSQVDPNHLAKVGQIDARVKQLLAVRGHYLFVWDDVKGRVNIWDVDNPKEPFLANYIDSIQGGVIIDGDYLYSFVVQGCIGGCGDLVVQYSLIDPLDIPVTNGVSGFYISAFQVTEQRFYYLDQNNTVYYVDLAEFHENHAGELTQTAGITNVCKLLLAWGTYLFYQDCDGNFSALNYANPDVPVNAVLATNTVVNQIKGVGNHVYWHTYDEINGVSRFNKAALANLMAISSINISEKINDWYVNDGITYIMTEAGTIHFLSVNAPTISVISEYNLPEMPWKSFVFRDNFLYVLGDNKLFLLDVRDPYLPKPAGTFTDPLVSSQPAQILAMAQSGNYVYAVDTDTPDGEGLYAINVSDRVKPVLEGFFPRPESAILLNTRDIAVVDEYVYVVEVGNSFFGTSIAPLSVVDISQPANMTLVYTMPLTVSANVLEVAGEYAYTVGFGGLQVIDIDSPSTPELIGFTSVVTTGIDIAVTGEYIYVVSDDYQIGNYFHVFDVSDPTQPVKIGQYDTPGEAQNILINGRYAYFADGSAGISVYDIIDPTQPQFVVSFGPIWPSSIDVSGEYLYIAHNYLNELYRFDISDINNPVLLSTNKINDPTAVFAFGSDIYVADEGPRLSLLKDTGFSSISGQTLDVIGEPVLGVAMNTRGNIQRVTNEEGHYIFSDLESGAYIITPTLPGWIFWPLTRTVIVPEDAVGQNFTVLAEPATAVLTPDTTTTLIYTDTQGSLTTLIFPPGAISTTTSITLTPRVMQSKSGYRWAKHGFALTGMQNGQVIPELTFAAPVSLTISYSAADVALIIDEELSLWRMLKNGWQANGTSCGTTVQDKVQNNFEASICTTGVYALFGVTAQHYFPVIANQHNTYDGNYLLWLGFAEDPGATHFLDASGHGHDGFCVGDQCPIRNTGETAVHFDGKNDYISLGNPDGLTIENEIILSARVKVEATDGIRNIIAHGYDVWPKGEVVLRVRDGMYEVGSWDGGNHFASYPIPSEDLGRWVDLHGTYDGVAWRLYRNGVEVAVTVDSIGAVFVNGTWAIGARGNGSERFFAGSINDVSISVPE